MGLNTARRPSGRVVDQTGAGNTASDKIGDPNVQK